MKNIKVLAVLSSVVFLSLSSCGFNVSSSLSDSTENSSSLPSSVTDSSDSSLDSSKTSDVISSSVSSSSSSSSSVPSLDEDPYENMTSAAFYKNYNRASSLQDAIYRTNHNFMSGSISDQIYKATISSSRPMENNLFVRNTTSRYGDGGKSYTVIDANGTAAYTIYKGGAYVTLEEVASYVYAFGDIPANYDEDKDNTTGISSEPWGKYLRVNHSYFSDDTTDYVYEPELPDAYSGKNNGTKKYYELDIGTTGCTESYVYGSGVYNNGKKINRGVSRLVYTRLYRNGNRISSSDERHVFYTYNHYNDFEEYLNYENGWGKRFGNMEGGGSYNGTTSKYVTDYPETSLKAL